MLKAFIFDLDGTLWQTKASYIYAYNKVCDKYGITERLSNEMVLNYLGIKLSDLLPLMFPWAKATPEALKFALYYSIEYILANPDDCCYEGIYEALQQLSKDYDLYIVSNCPRAYADTFLKVSGTTDFIKQVYTIEDGSKSENLAKIASSIDGKLVFVGDSNDDYNALTDKYNQYFCFAKYGYKSCLNYDFSINSPKDLITVAQQLEIKERQSKGNPYRTFSYGDNQITLIEKSDKVAYFGFVNYVDEGFDYVVKELKAYVGKTLIGPIDFNTFYSYRFALDNFDWKLYPDCGGEDALPVFINNGFRIHREYASALAGIDRCMWARAKKAKIPNEYHTEILHGDEVFDRLDSLYDLSMEAFSQAYLYEPIQLCDFTEIYAKGLRALNADLVIIYRNNTPVAFNFCYEDPLKRFYVCKTIGIAKEERNKNVFLHLLDCSFAMMEEKGYDKVLLHFRNLKGKSHFDLFNRTKIKEKKYVLLELSND